MQPWKGLKGRVFGSESCLFKLFLKGVAGALLQVNWVLRVLFRYNGGPIAWKSNLQKTIALSTAEAEYYSASTAAAEVIYLKHLLTGMGRV